ncbi:hypothetical protein KQ313_11070 [Synechococcus sp. CS-1325]|uniref:hypothetical protein n=1 Tax=unclassified Synechococcus TaxID=2626047 RepID=UPI000DB8630C|nr:MULTISPECIES: hypothetical protein [unclassified Synechococcus]MCT0200220.1 hypothetical protein [Synechococcus sp. CS-1325]MCT0213175.1 hypothetical protein [Synechococcus sp. CS-1326]MCT0233336.1 hypothetical protein [Synechococcus sp. CS-1327]PZU96602.1 MAG: hypothetical protein DCF24_13815 [Cyanobium sp.]
MAHASLHRLLAAQVSWAERRIASLDAAERYEDSFALTEEFREWILCIDDQPERVEALLLPKQHWPKAIREP